MENEKLTEHDIAIIEYIAACRKRNFHEKTMDALAVFAGSPEAVALFGSTTNGYKKLTELINSLNDEQKVINEFVGMFNV